MKNIEEFVDKIIEEKGFNTKDPEVVAQIKSDLLSRVEDRINAMIMANMPESALVEFEGLLDAKDEKVTEAFIREQILDIDEKVASTLLAFRTMYVG